MHLVNLGVTYMVIGEGDVHSDYILTGGDIATKCHSTKGKNLIAAILDKLGEGHYKHAPDDKFKVMVKDQFTLSLIFL